MDAMIFILMLAVPLGAGLLLFCVLFFMWYVLFYLPSPVPTSELAMLSPEMKELLATDANSTPILRAQAIQAKKILQNRSIAEAQSAAILDERVKPPN